MRPADVRFLCRAVVTSSIADAAFGGIGKEGPAGRSSGRTAYAVLHVSKIRSSKALTRGTASCGW